MEQNKIGKVRELIENLNNCYKFKQGSIIKTPTHECYVQLSPDEKKPDWKFVLDLNAPEHDNHSNHKKPE